MFIVFEGIDGCGKTTLSRRLVEELDKRGRKPYLTFEPTNSYFGEVVKKCVEIGDPYLIVLSFALDRARHTSEIKRMIEEGYDVVCDRYFYSTLAYQGAMLSEYMGVDEALQWIEEIHRPFIIFPDKTFLIDISPEESLKRIEKRDSVSVLNLFEKEKFLKRVREIYLRISDKYRMIVLDGKLTTEEILDKVLFSLKI